MLDDSPDSASSTLAAATYSASAWVLAPAGRTLTLRVRERLGGSVVRSNASQVTANGSWQLLALTTAPTADGSSLGVEVVASLARGSKAHVDDVSLHRT